MKLSDERVVDIPAISTGSLGLDIALGIGGFPRGRVIEIYGPESSGKTTLASVISHEIDAQFITLNAVLDGTKDLKEFLICK